MPAFEFVLRIFAAVSILFSSTPLPLGLVHPPSRPGAQSEPIITPTPPPPAGEPTATPQPEVQPESSPEFHLYLPLLFKDNRPRPDFSATPLIGSLPLTVTFANRSTHASVYTWDFGDGSHLTQNSALIPQNSVTHVYTRAGVYTVSLTAAADTGLTETLTRPGYLTVLPPADEANLFFIENTGQFDDAARFVVPGEAGTLFLAEDALWVSVLGEPAAALSTPAEPDDPGRHERTADAEPWPGVNLKLSFPGANPRPRLEPFNRLETTVSYFSGSDPEQWQPDVPVWGGVRYVDLYPGIDLEVTSERGQLVQRLVRREPVAAPAAGVSAAAAGGNEVSLRVEGAEALRVAGDALQVQTAVGEVSWPLLEQVTAARSFVPAPTTAQINGSDIVAPFAAGEMTDGVSALAGETIFNLLYSTYLGGSAGDPGVHLAVDPAGNAYVAGYTWSTDFPTTPGAFDSGYNNGGDVFVTKVNPSGAGLVYSTYLGGSGSDEGYDLAIDTDGNAWVSGYTASANFPTTAGAFDTGYNSGGDAFVAKLNATGTALVYSTYLGGSGEDDSDGLAVDADGNVYVGGYTWSANFPTTAGAFDTGYNGGGDVFITKLNPAGSGLVYSTYLGGSDDDEGYSLTVDADGNAYVTGLTTSADFSITSGAFDTGYNGNEDAFVAKVNPDGSELVYSTYLGGSTVSGGTGNDWGDSIVVDAAGNAYVAGRTASSDFPTTAGAYDTTRNSGDAFVTRVNPAGTGLVYSTYLGGSDNDWGYGIALDAAGNAWVTGYTYSADFPTTAGAIDSSYNGSGDAFVTRINPGGSGLSYSTWLGGSGYDEGNEITTDAAGNIYLTGRTASTNFPTTAGAFDTSSNGGSSDAYVTKLVLPLMLTKAAPAAVLASQPITYTLTVTNTGQVTATNLVVTDTLPAGASYISGGTQVGGVVSWNLASLGVGQSASVSLVVTATTTVTNSDYAVMADGGLAAIGQLPVTTRVYPSPSADFSAFPLSGSWPLLVQFLNSSTGADSYAWDFGDGITATLSSPTHTYAAAGVYTVTLTAANLAGSHTLTRTDYINAWSPVLVDFSATPLTGTVPLTVTFTNSSTGASTYGWDFGDGSHLTQNSTLITQNLVTHVYTQAGVYSVTLAAGNGIVTETLTRTHYLTVTEPLVVDFSAFPPQGAAPLLVQFLNNSTGATNYGWDFGDGITSTLPSPTHTYAAAGVYTVTLAAGNELNGTLTRTHYLTVTTPVTAAFTATPLTGTVPLTVTFVNSSTGAMEYAWDFGDGSHLTQNSTLIHHSKFGDPRLHPGRGVHHQPGRRRAGRQ
jgi:uncharacterized repeat protein (TIGR01451 family)